MSHWRVIFWSAVAAVMFGVIVAGLSVLTSTPAEPADVTLPPVVSATLVAEPADVTELAPTAHRSIYSSAAFFDEAYDAAGPAFVRNAADVVAVVVPHHLFVKEHIAALFKSFADEPVDTVVLVGPDHFQRAAAPAVLSRLSWQTPYGELLSDPTTADYLELAGAITDETPFEEDHAVTGLVAFIRRSLPEAHFVPMLLREDCAAERVDSLAAVLTELSAEQRILVVASVDFSHEADAATADRQDDQAVTAMRAFDYANITGLKLDSPASIRLVTRYADLLGAHRVRDLFGTHSSRLVGQPDVPGTSHRFMSFSFE